jgi:plasmid stabilization system protein ParE
VSLPVFTTPEADLQIREVDGWWHANRPASPDSFAYELGSAFDIIARTPHIGRSYRHSTVGGTRRILLPATRYHVYYVASAEAVMVLAVWHARRGVGPPLRSAAPPDQSYEDP